MNEKAQREIQEANMYREFSDVLRELESEHLAGLTLKLARICEGKAMVLDELTRLHAHRAAQNAETRIRLL